MFKREYRSVQYSTIQYSSPVNGNTPRKHLSGAAKRKRRKEKEKSLSKGKKPLEKIKWKALRLACKQVRYGYDQLLLYVVALYYVYYVPVPLISITIATRKLLMWQVCSYKLVFCSKCTNYCFVVKCTVAAAQNSSVLV